MSFHKLQCDLSSSKQQELLKKKAFRRGGCVWGSRMHPLITTLARELKGQPDESGNNWQTWRAGGNPQEDWEPWSPFHLPALRENKLYFTNLWADVGLPLMIWLNGWMRDLEHCFLEVKSNCSATLSRSLFLCFDRDWLVCLVWVFWSGNGARGKYNCNTIRTVITAGVRPSFVLCLRLD